MTREAEMDSEIPYEASVVTAFAALLGYQVGRATSPDRYEKGRMISVASFERTKRDSLWGDVVTRHRDHGALIEFKRSDEKDLIEKEVKKGKIDLIPDLGDDLPDISRRCHLFAYGGTNGQVIPYADLRELLEETPVFEQKWTFDEFTKSVVREDNLGSIDELQRYLSALAEAGEKSGGSLSVTGYLLSIGEMGEVSILVCDGALHDLLAFPEETIETDTEEPTMSSDPEAYTEEVLDVTPEEPGNRKKKGRTPGL